MPFDLLHNEPWRGVRDQALSNLTGVGWRGAFPVRVEGWGGGGVHF
jgi:hypothetical protein